MLGRIFFLLFLLFIFLVFYHFILLLRLYFICSLSTYALLYYFMFICYIYIALMITYGIIPCGISNGNPEVNSVAESEWTVVRFVLGIQLHVPKWDQIWIRNFCRV